MKTISPFILFFILGFLVSSCVNARTKKNGMRKNPLSIFENNTCVLWRPVERAESSFLLVHSKPSKLHPSKYFERVKKKQKRKKKKNTPKKTFKIYLEGSKVPLEKKYNYALALTPKNDSITEIYFFYKFRGRFYRSQSQFNNKMIKEKHPREIEFQEVIVSNKSLLKKNKIPRKAYIHIPRNKYRSTLKINPTQDTIQFNLWTGWASNPKGYRFIHSN
jgi:hypothetical protein